MSGRFLVTIQGETYAELKNNLANFLGMENEGIADAPAKKGRPKKVTEVEPSETTEMSGSTVGATGLTLENATPAPVALVIPTADEVKAVLQALLGAGKVTEAKALMAKFGAAKMSEIKEENRVQFIAEGKALVG